MYKLKGQSLNKRAGQGMKYRELVHPAGLCTWFVQLDHPLDKVLSAKEGQPPSNEPEEIHDTHHISPLR